MGCYFLLQEIFPTHRSNPHLLQLLHWQVGPSPLSHLGNPLWQYLEMCWVAATGQRECVGCGVGDASAFTGQSSEILLILLQSLVRLSVTNHCPVQNVNSANAGNLELEWYFLYCSKISWHFYNSGIAQRYYGLSSTPPQYNEYHNKVSDTSIFPLRIKITFMLYYSILSVQ